ncbi:MAG: peptide chain release factor 1 [Chloroflexi bacterium]|nr:peptide chain release factor 1 [Chloroflexota bacterium]MCH2308479.1 peptide chain release factor 1 [SAR202 cluster bacterium]MQG05162.1 peptide chain release factor 1 [SAR202 cluster bacterium]GIT15428.1 MAG: peptide chain release factor 1 [Chloroflexota bacterium]
MLENLDEFESRYDDLVKSLEDPTISQDYTKVEKITREIASLKDIVLLIRQYKKLLIDIDESTKMLLVEDRELATLAREDLDNLVIDKAKIENEIRQKLILSDPNDEKNVMLEIRAGVGGDEAGLFASELFTMYTRYAQKQNWKVDLVSITQSGLGSIKEVIFQITGKGAYSILKHESGGHRVQRIPITESGGRIHTSSATVAVLPEANEVDVYIKNDDLKIDVFRASGAGGQSVQKNSTAIRITHLPTGIVAVCQDERSQLKNKEKAMSVIRSRILGKEIEKQQKKISDSRRSQVGSGDRSDRIRTYNFPQSRVTDHRINLTKHTLESFLDGDIEEIISALLDHERSLKLSQALQSG